MRVQPHLPSSPLTATVTVEIGVGLLGVQGREKAGAAGPQDQDVRLDLRERHHNAPSRSSTPSRRGWRRRVAPRRTASRHGNPYRRAAGRTRRMRKRHRLSGWRVVEIDVLDLLDPGRFQRRRAADDGEIGPAEIGERRQRVRTHAALADDQAHAFALHQRTRETLHAHRGGGADAERRIARPARPARAQRGARWARYGSPPGPAGRGAWRVRGRTCGSAWRRECHKVCARASPCRRP